MPQWFRQIKNGMNKLINGSEINLWNEIQNPRKNERITEVEDWSWMSDQLARVDWMKGKIKLNWIPLNQFNSICKIGKLKLNESGNQTKIN